jgi:hypothetical protein
MSESIRKSNSHASGTSRGSRNDALVRVFGVSQDSSRIVEERLPDGCQLRAAPIAYEQPYAQVSLHERDCLAQWRLVYADALRRAGKVKFFGDGHEIIKFA